MSLDIFHIDFLVKSVDVAGTAGEGVGAEPFVEVVLFEQHSSGRFNRGIADATAKIYIPQKTAAEMNIVPYSLLRLTGEMLEVVPVREERAPLGAPSADLEDD